MVRKFLKKLLKNNLIVHRLSVWIVFAYLKLVYFTNKWEFVFSDGLSEHDINKKDGVLFALWHNRLAFGMYIYRNYDNVSTLASPHNDGKLITDIIKKMEYKVIQGSTNRNPTKAIRGIIKEITSGGKVVITPDGPRGPLYKVNSNITRIAHKYKKDIIPVSCIATKYFELKSWDKMIIPRNFGRIIVNIGKPLDLSGDDKKDIALLEEKMIELSNGFDKK